MDVVIVYLDIEAVLVREDCAFPTCVDGLQFVMHPGLYRSVGKEHPHLFGDDRYAKQRPLRRGVDELCFAPVAGPARDVINQKRVL